MASRSDSTNIVRLPTAAKRQVKQPCNKPGREARRQLREEQRGPKFDYVSPCIREAEARIRALEDMPSGPAVNMVRNLIQSLGTDDSKRVLGMIRFGLDHDDPFAKEVEAVMKQVAGTTFGDHNAFQQALWRLGWTSVERAR